MIRLKHLFTEISNNELNRCLKKIKNDQFKLIGAGDNGRVYEIDGEDKLFKITQERDEYKVASIIVNQYSKFTTFIPVYYVDNKNMYIMANASKLPNYIKRSIDNFMFDFSKFARNQGGEVSIFEFASQTNNIDPIVINFINALQIDINKLNIPDIELDLDFKSDNIMIWNGKLVMIDW